MKTNLPERIAAAARTAARMDYRLSQLQSQADQPTGVQRAQPTSRLVRLARLRRDLVVVQLERLRNEFYLTLIDSARQEPREAASSSASRHFSYGGPIQEN